MGIETIGGPFLWIGFTVFIVLMLILDLGIFNRKVHTIKVREALIWTVIWIAVSLLFAVFVWHQFGPVKALEFLTGYVIEKALSTDNLFFFFVVFSYFATPDHLQHRVLFWGIVGAMIMRAVFIAAGTALMQQFAWIIYPFGLLLIWTGIKLLFQKTATMDPERKLLVRIFKRFIPISNEYHGKAFIIVKNGRRHATMLLLVLVTIEFTDLVFAADSLPAIFAVTTDPFIIYTSNILAVFGLRALYFALAGSMNKFHHLKYGLALILTFVGIKMLISHYIDIPIILSLAIVALLLALSIAASFLYPQKAILVFKNKKPGNHP